MTYEEERQQFINRKFLDASQIGTLDEVKNYLDKGADINTLNGYAIINAIRRNNVELTKFLINAGINFNDVNESSEPALFYAASENNLAIVKMLIQAGADVNIEYRPHGRLRIYRPIYYAATSANADVVNTLLDAGAKIYIEHGEGWGLTVHARDVRNNVKLKGTNVFARMAAMNDDFFVDMCNDCTVTEVRAAINAGANVNARCYRPMAHYLNIEADNATALIHACQYNYKNPLVAMALLDAGADPTIKDKYGMTAFKHLPKYDFSYMPVDDGSDSYKLYMRLANLDPEWVSFHKGLEAKEKQKQKEQVVREITKEVKERVFFDIFHRKKIF